MARLQCCTTPQSPQERFRDVRAKLPDVDRHHCTGGATSILAQREEQTCLRCVVEPYRPIPDPASDGKFPMFLKSLPTKRNYAIGVLEPLDQSSQPWFCSSALFWALSRHANRRQTWMDDHVDRGEPSCTHLQSNDTRTAHNLQVLSTPMRKCDPCRLPSSRFGAFVGVLEHHLAYPKQLILPCQGRFVGWP